VDFALAKNTVLASGIVHSIIFLANSFHLRFKVADFTASLSLLLLRTGTGFAPVETERTFPITLSSISPSSAAGASCRDHFLTLYSLPEINFSLLLSRLRTTLFCD